MKNVQTKYLKHHWMRFVKRASTKVSGPSYAPRFVVELMFRRPNCCIFAGTLHQSSACTMTKYKWKIAQVVHVHLGLLPN